MQMLKKKYNPQRFLNTFGAMRNVFNILNILI